MTDLIGTVYAEKKIELYIKSSAVFHENQMG